MNQKEFKKKSSGFTSIAPYIAAKYYVNRIAQAWFFSIVLEKFTQAKIRFESPVFDLGCGNGIFGRMLKEMRLVESIELSLDYSKENLVELKKYTKNKLACGDAASLPIKSNYASTVLANCVISSIPTNNESDIDKIISEVHRVLTRQGLFLLTVPTTWFNKNLIITKIIESISTPSLKMKYLKWLEKNVDHYQVYDKKKWLTKLELSNFRIEKVEFFFTPHQGFWWNIFTLPFISFWFKLLNSINIEIINKQVIVFLEKFFRKILSKEGNSDHNNETAGFILIAAYKN